LILFGVLIGLSILAVAGVMLRRWQVRRRDAGYSMLN